MRLSSIIDKDQSQGCNQIRQSIGISIGIDDYGDDESPRAKRAKQRRSAVFLSNDDHHASDKSRSKLFSFERFIE